MKRMIKVLDLRSGSTDELNILLTGKNQMVMENVLQSVEDIVNSVRANGDKAVLEYTRMFDGVKIDPGEIKVAAGEIEKACNNVDSKLVEVIRKAGRNIENFHLKQKEKSWFTTEQEGVVLGQLYRPLETVGVYVPGGTAPLPSSVLMNVIPAKVAGVGKIIMATPPGKDGSINPAILVAAKEAGVDEIYRMGGAQAIAALAFGTETVPKVDKIVGPGNIYVNTAKRIVFGYCDIDMFAGPSDITVVADESANSCYIAADLLSQAEHDVLSSSILVTCSEKLAYEVKDEVERQFSYLTRKEILTRSLNDNSAIIIVESIERAVDIANIIAPEHLELCVKEPFNLLGCVKNAGAIFLGSFASEPLGDYFAGPNHVLPTSGTARFFSPLSVADFVKKSSVISYTRNALQQVKDDIILFAEAEGLTAHANAIRIRFDAAPGSGNNKNEL